MTTLRLRSLQNLRIRGFSPFANRQLLRTRERIDAIKITSFVVGFVAFTIQTRNRIYEPLVIGQREAVVEFIHRNNPRVTQDLQGSVK